MRSGKPEKTSGCKTDKCAEGWSDRCFQMASVSIIEIEKSRFGTYYVCLAIIVDVYERNPL